MSSESTTRRKVVLASGALVSGLSGCVGGSDDDGGGETATDGNGGETATDGNGDVVDTSNGKEFTLLLSSPSPEEEEALNALGDDFEAETGHELNIEGSGFGQWAQKFASMVRGGNSPDVTQISISHLGGAYQDDQLQPVSEVYDFVVDMFGEVSDEFVLEVDGETWTVPFNTKGYNWSYRADLFSDVGAEFTFEDTGWEEWLSAVEMVDEESGIAGNLMANADTSKGHIDGMQWLWSNGVRVYKEKGGEVEVVLDEGRDRDRTIEVLEFVQQLDEFNPMTTNATWVDCINAWSNAQGASVMYDTAGSLDVLRDTNPQHRDNTKGIITPWKRHDRDDNAASWPSVDSMAIPKGAENPDVGREFIKFWISSDQHYFDFITARGMHRVPVQKSRYDNEYWINETKDVVKNRPDVRENNRLLLDYQKPLIFTENGTLNLDAGKAYGSGTIGALFARAIKGNMSPEEAIEQTADDLRNI